MNDTIASALLIALSVIVIVTNVVVYSRFKRTLHKIEESLHR